jgi:hypothetical protein
MMSKMKPSAVVEGYQIELPPHVRHRSLAIVMAITSLALVGTAGWRLGATNLSDHQVAGRADAPPRLLAPCLGVFAAHAEARKQVGRGPHRWRGPFA